MRTIYFWGMTLAVAVGCGSAATSAPDFNSLETTLTKPTGTLAPGAEPAVIGGYNDQASNANDSAFGASATLDAAPGGLAASSLAPLETPTSQWCPALDANQSGSCNCPGGGTLTFDLSAIASLAGKGKDQPPMGPIDAVVSISASKCSMDEKSIDGSLYYKIKALQADLKDLFLLYALHYTETPPEKKVDVDYLLQGGKVTFAIQVQDGTVLVSAQGNWDKSTKTGTLVVTDKNVTWTCTLVNAKGTCSDGKGTTRNVT